MTIRGDGAENKEGMERSCRVWESVIVSEVLQHLAKRGPVVYSSPSLLNPAVVIVSSTNLIRYIAQLLHTLQHEKS